MVIRAYQVRDTSCVYFKPGPVRLKLEYTGERVRLREGARDVASS